MLPPLLLPGRYRSLDLWRGVACLSVVVYHAGFVLERTELNAPGAAYWPRLACMGLLRLLHLGVPIFFVISGYCIAASADSSRRKEESPWTFLKRRVWRIYPTYWVALVGLIALLLILEAAGLTRFYTSVPLLILHSPAEFSWQQWLGNFTLTEGWRARIWGASHQEIITRVAWTLCYEEQFYFICFLVLVFAPRRLYRVIGILTALIVAFRIGCWHMGWLEQLDGFFPYWWHEFAAGIAVYWRLTVARSALEKRAVEAMLAIMCGVGLLWEIRSTAGAGAFGLLLIALRRWDDRLVDANPLFRGLGVCGQRCYSIYLVHLPICLIAIGVFRELGVEGFWTRTFLVVPVVSLVATAAGWLFFSLVERQVHAPKLVTGSRQQAAPTSEPAPALG